jgi:hypothetical protein
MNDINDGLEPCAILAKLLCSFLVVPDVRVFQLASDFYQLFRLGIKVKDTP